MLASLVLTDGLDQLNVLLGGERLWSLDRQAKTAVEDQLRQDTKGSRNTKQDSVERLLSQAVVLQQDTGVGVHIRPWVLGLTVLGQDTWGDLVDVGHQLEQLVVWHVLQCKLSLGGVARVCLSQDSVTVAWNNSAGVKSVPQVFLNSLLGVVTLQVVSQLEQPFQNFLVGSAVQRTSQTVQTSGKRQEWGGQSGADQVSGVGRNVTTLVVRVNGQVQSHQLQELLVLAKSEQGGQVGTVVQVLGDGTSQFAIVENVSVDSSSDVWQLGQQLNGVLVSVFPVVGLWRALGVCLGKLRLRLQGSDGDRELGHWVQVGWGAVNQLLNVLWQGGSGRQLLGQGLGLGGRWNLAGQQQPEQSFWQRLASTWSLWQLLLDVWDGSASETDTLDWVQHRTLPDKALDTTHTTVGLFQENFANHLVYVSMRHFCAFPSIAYRRGLLHARCGIFARRMKSEPQPQQQL